MSDQAKGVDYSRYKRGASANYTHHVGPGVPYGNLPEDMLVAKYEHSGNIVGQNYRDYSRELIKDRTPDTPTFEYEKPRRNYNAAGFLNLLHKGGRGTENFPAHPEINLEQTDKDPRQSFTDPDFKKMNDQAWARMRFKKMYAGNSNLTIPGGHFHPTQINEMRNYYVNVSKPRMRIFSTAFDGRQQKQSVIPFSGLGDTAAAIKTEESHGEILKNALSPQRKTAALSNLELHGSKWYNQHTMGHRFSVAKYGQNFNKIRLGDGPKKRELTTDTDFIDARCSVIKMAKIMNCISSRLNKIEEDATRNGVNCTSKIRAADVRLNDFERALYKTINEVRFNNAYPPLGNRGAALIKDSGLSNQDKTHLDGRKLTIADVVKIYNQANGGDVTRAMHKSIGGSKLRTAETHAANSMRQSKAVKDDVPKSIIDVNGKNLSTKNYKNIAGGGGIDKPHLDTEKFTKNSKYGASIKTPSIKELPKNINNVDQNLEFGGNGSIDHFSGRNDIYTRPNHGKIRSKSDKEDSLTPNISK